MNKLEEQSNHCKLMKNKLHLNLTYVCKVCSGKWLLMAMATLLVFVLSGWTTQARHNGDLQTPQERVVSGRVLDIQEQPIAGASVVAAGSSKGVTPDDDGRFGSEARRVGKEGGSTCRYGGPAVHKK